MCLELDLSWSWKALAYREKDLIRLCGMDGYLLVRVVRFCWALMSGYCLVALVCLFPVYYAAAVSEACALICAAREDPSASAREAWESEATCVCGPIDRASMATLGPGSAALWTPVVVSYLLTAMTFYLARLEYQAMVRIQSHCWEQVPQAYSVLVEHIPPHLRDRSGRRLWRYFNNMFPDQVISVDAIDSGSRVFNTIVSLGSQRNYAVWRLERLEALRRRAAADARGADPESCSCSCPCDGPPPAEAVRELSEELQALNVHFALCKARYMADANNLGRRQRQSRKQATPPGSGREAALGLSSGQGAAESPCRPPMPLLSLGGAALEDQEEDEYVGTDSSDTGGAGVGSSDEEAAVQIPGVGAGAADNEAPEDTAGFNLRKVAKAGLGRPSPPVHSHAHGRKANGVRSLSGEAGGGDPRAYPSAQSHGHAQEVHHKAGADREREEATVGLLGTGGGSARSQPPEPKEKAAERAFLTAAFVTFRTLSASTVASQSQIDDTSTMRVLPAPEPLDVAWDNLGMGTRSRMCRRMLTKSAFYLILLFWGVLTSVIGASTSTTALARQFPTLRELLAEHPSLSQYLDQLAPLVLVMLVGVVNPLMGQLARFEGRVSESAADKRAMERYFAFLVIQVFLFYSVAGTVFKTFVEIIQQPSKIVDTLGATIPKNAAFYIQFVIVKLFWMLCFELLRIADLMLVAMRRIVAGAPLTARERLSMFCGCFELYYPSPINIPSTLAQSLLVLFIAVVYAVIQPLILPAAFVFFALANVVYTTVLTTSAKVMYDSGGRYWWPSAYRCVVLALVTAQLTLIGVLLIKQGFRQALPMWVLVPATVFFGYKVEGRYAALVSTLPVHLAAKIDHKRRGMRVMQVRPAVWQYGAIRPGYRHLARTDVVIVYSYMHPVLGEADRAVPNKYNLEAPTSPSLAAVRALHAAHTQYGAIPSPPADAPTGLEVVGDLEP